MAQRIDNHFFLSIDGVDISAYVSDINLSEDVPAVSANHGADKTHEQRLAGLMSNTLSFVVAYDDVAYPQLKALIGAGTHRVIYGEYGNEAGRPKHEQDFIFTGIPHAQAQDKSTPLAWPVTGISQDAPIFNSFGASYNTF